MNAQQRATVISTILNRWYAEARELAKCILEIRRWMRQVSDWGIPHFGEMATRLSLLRQRMARHFECEHSLAEEIRQTDPLTFERLSELSSNCIHDHQKFLEQLDDLCRRLNESEPPFKTWQSATKEAEAIVDRMEQHEELEAQNLELVAPAPQ